MIVVKARMPPRISERGRLRCEGWKATLSYLTDGDAAGEATALVPGEAAGDGKGQAAGLVCLSRPRCGREILRSRLTGQHTQIEYEDQTERSIDRHVPPTGSRDGY